MVRLALNLVRISFLAVVLILTATYGMANVQKQADPWLDPVVTKGELDSTSWINANTQPTAHFQADIFGGELIMGMTTRVPIVGGDWANAPDPVSNMNASQQIYETPIASQASALCKQYNLSYVFVPLNREVFCGFGWIPVDATKFDNSTYFKLQYANDDVRIYKVV
ncbi:MAG TPA: hypothetical protein VEG65_01405 [Candidatus Bathyarchaeia archaeon]|nr:hypothetical protein [Candidatus Bathyarchaeia archaeon]